MMHNLGCLSLALLLAACGTASTGNGGGTDAGPTPDPTLRLNVASPADNATIELGADAPQSVPIQFVMGGRINDNEGGCDAASCGHVALQIDDGACLFFATVQNNVSGPGDTSVDALFRACASPVGAHTLTLELRDRDDHAVIDAKGNRVRATIHVTTTATTSDKTVSITNLRDDDQVQLTGNDILEIVATATGVELEAPGTCAGRNGCGHLAGAAADCPGAPDEGTGTLDVSLAACVQAAGEHTVRVLLVDDSGAPIRDRYNHAIGAMVQVETLAPN